MAASAYTSAMRLWWLLFFVCLAILVVIFIISIILWRTRSSSTTQEFAAPTLENLYAGGTAKNNIELPGLVKPVALTSDSKVQPTKDFMRLVVGATLTQTPFGAPQLVGPVFQPITPLQITAVQFIEQLAADPEAKRPMVLYDFTANTYTPLTPAGNPPRIENGFRVIDISPPVELTAFQQYAVVGLVTAADMFIQNANVFYTIDSKSIGSVTGPLVTNVSQLTGPPTYDSDIFKHFYSFQTQVTQNTTQITWSVDAAKGGFGTFPPGYCRGLNISTTGDTKSILIEPGFANSSQFSASIIVPQDLTLVQQAGINGFDTFDPVVTPTTQTWYNVYVISSSRYGLPSAGLLSLGSLEPNPMPLNYDNSRRVGAVFYDAGTFFGFSQFGDGATRVSNYIVGKGGGNVPIGGYVRMGLGSAVPPTATACHLVFTGNMSNVSSTSNSGPDGAEVRVRPVGATTTVGPFTVSLPNNPAPSADMDVLLNASPIPIDMEISLFVATPDGSIPNNPSNPNVGVFSLQYFVQSFSESI